MPLDLSQTYQRYCEKARFASAMRCVSSRFFHGGTTIVRGVKHFAWTDGQPWWIRCGRGLGIDQPANGECLTAVRTDINRHLIGRATNTAGAHFNCGERHCRELMEQGKPAPASTWPERLRECAVNDGFGNRLLSSYMDGIHGTWYMTRSPNFGSGLISRFSARWRRDIFDASYFGRLAPYFERRCLRFLTPWVSRTPRML